MDYVANEKIYKRFTSDIEDLKNNQSANEISDADDERDNEEDSGRNLINQTTLPRNVFLIKCHVILLKRQTHVYKIIMNLLKYIIFIKVNFKKLLNFTYFIQR